MSFFPRLRRGALVFLALALAACAATPPPSGAGATAERREPVTILVSIDGFRADYLDRGLTPNLNALAARGARAAMRPSFPTKTFPNHYTLVTGLRPDRHGVVDNNMEDPRKPGVLFKISNAEAINPFWWDAAEPLWITAERQGIRTGTSLWPGAEAPWGTTRPASWIRYDEHITSRQRVDTVLDWIRRPAANRPRFVTLYLETVDTAGHDFGPEGRETNEAVREVDGEIGYLVAQLQAMRQPANLVVVSDHGMEATAPERVVRIDRLVDAAAIHVVSDGPFMTLAAAPGHEAQVEAKLLGRRDHFQCWRKGELPARFAYGRNPRILPIFCLADHGWLLYARDLKPPFDLGNHGYDNEDPDMRALFVAAGPGVAKAGTLPLFDNVDVYPFVARLIGVAPRASDGDAATLQPLLRQGSGGAR
ncbi:MAG: alkaline phosphatase family protein [Alphaproteobacteria bacterium]|nr:alkaline phosphatase family protein [Alphaproteobacteria bacterium]MBV9370545.1 alkaline phosphatase family protein [Alphaproteobacteria bacterium]MBV9900629.1 alkaline phosphatase family protein [Alphaproteobacteria bacterium]